MNFLVIGTGLIGKKRVDALVRLKSEGHKIDEICVYDPVSPYVPTPDVSIVNETSFLNKNLDWVFIATPHNVVKDWVSVASSWGCRILIEKPMGRNYQEAKEIYSYLKIPSQMLVGFNYRFFEPVKRLCDDVLMGKFGRIISINMEIGHGGKPEDKESWKLNKEEGSPDALLDPGIHMLDLLDYMFPRRAIPVYGISWSGFWGTGVKEEVCMTYTINNFAVTLKSSLVKWKNTFRIEVNGVEGYGVVSGRGGNYGKQTYRTGVRWGWKDGYTEEPVCESDCEDSFYLETKSLVEDKGNANARGAETLDVMRLYSDSVELLK